ncbi:MAG: DEAD/DEAH box helicase family protein [Deltaproteobacteria bacterium]|nr:DEAD/DEAH box helicase family protein [Deltaproteobacteria bacterium]
MLIRFSSRRQRLDQAFLSEKLKGARSYLRIAGYFRSSIFELVGEEITGIPDVKIVCNSDLDLADIAVSKAAREGAIKEKWNEVAVATEALLHQERYRRLYDLLVSGNLEIRVVPRDHVFVHGKAGVIELADGHKTSFLGSINESRAAFSENYEILWEDSSDEGIQWVEEEFEALWNDAYPLPLAIIEEIERVANRVEIRFDKISPLELPAAVLVEAPIYRGGEQLQPWQRAFVVIALQHMERYGRVRLLLADEVGLGKTLSMATAAMITALLGDGPVLILCPSTLTFQWQVELKDRLGIPSAVWLSNRKMWVDDNGHIIKTNGAADVVRCPYRIAIVSTGLIFQDSEERSALLGRRGGYGTVILDEAHKARRRGGLGDKKDEPNNLFDFMLQIGTRTKNILLGTATPFQTEVYELWDLIAILNSGVEFVLGREYVSIWGNCAKALPFVKGLQAPADEREAWDLLRAPLPPAEEHTAIATLRMNLEIDDKVFFSERAFSSLGFLEQELVRQTIDNEFFQHNNPILRHTVLRRRDVLEDMGLLEKVGVSIHPDPNAPAGEYEGQNFSDLGLMTNHPFNLAYKAAEEFTDSLRERTAGAGFMKSLLLQRICSSFAAGKSTAGNMLRREVLEDEEDIEALEKALDGLTVTEAECLQRIVSELSRQEARDPKLSAVKYFLTEHRVDGKTWLEHGCIIFSQYYDTAYWVASELTKILQDEVVAVYAGVGKSVLFRKGHSAAVEREHIKLAVKRREIRLVVATDAASEGLNLQTLGTLINVDLPWNPSRLEQRLGRIKRFGQARRFVDMLNLVYSETRDDEVYRLLSRRLKDKYDIFGSLPDTIEDAWITDIEKLGEMMDRYMHLRREAINAFELRYQGSIDPDKNRWELCSKVLSRKDVVDKLSEAW